MKEDEERVEGVTMSVKDINREGVVASTST